MAGNYWRSLFRGIWAVPDGYDPVSPPSEADLEQFEADFGIRLPESYRTFVLQFGAGELAQEFMIFAPRCQANSDYDMTKFNQQFRRAFDKSKVLQKSYDDPQLIRRLLFFARTIGNDYFGWDPGDGGDKERPEYAVHFLPRLVENSRTVAGSFREFVEDLCLGDAYYDRYSASGERSLAGSRRVFVPAPKKRHKKKASGK